MLRGNYKIRVIVVQEIEYSYDTCIHLLLYENFIYHLSTTCQSLNCNICYRNEYFFVSTSHFVSPKLHRHNYLPHFYCHTHRRVHYQLRRQPFIALHSSLLQLSTFCMCNYCSICWCHHCPAYFVFWLSNFLQFFSQFYYIIFVGKIFGWSGN